MTNRSDMTPWDALDAAEAEALRSALPEDAALAETLRHWDSLCAHLRAELEAAVPERDLIALRALADRAPSALTPAEEARMIVAREALDAAAAEHPGLAAALARAADDCRAFEEAWDAETAPAPARRAADRAPRRAAPARRWVWRTVAGAAVIAFVGIVASVVQRDAGLETVRTAAGESRTVTLLDGSTVHLAERSALDFVADAGAERSSRDVRLTGRAVFEVVPGEAPFTVTTPTSVTTVLGTTFEVDADEMTSAVTLAEGRVRFASRQQPELAVELAPGQRTRLVGGGAPEAPQSVDATGALAWTGRLYLERTPLGEAAARMSEHYGARIDVPQHLAAEPVTGRFDMSRPVADNLRTLARAVGATARRADGGFELAD